MKPESLLARGAALLEQRGVVLAGVSAAGWPVIRWYAARLTDGSDEPLGLLPLLAAVLLAPRSGWRQPVPRRCQGVLAALLVVYGATFAFLPPLLRAVLWVSALAVVLVPSRASPPEEGVLAPASGPRSGPGWWMLMVLSLPVMATAQFYLGYPLRLVTTWLAAATLRLAGLEVTAEATVLGWRGERVLVDAPCSGIQMLWTAWVLAALLACLQRLDTRETLGLMRRAATWVFAGNTLRTTALFCIELRLWPGLPAAHDVVGLVFFAGVCGLVVWGTPARRGRARAAPLRTPPGAPETVRAGGWVWGAVALAALAPLLEPAAAVPSGRGALFPGWAAAPVPEEGVRVPLSKRDERFARGFPGEIGVFRRGRDRWIVRWVVQPTRTLHPAADCLRASGYTVTPGAAERDAAGGLWAGAYAQRGVERYSIRERITDARGGAWTDVSGWYWAAVLGKSQGPWWAVTRVSEL